MEEKRNADELRRMTQDDDRAKDDFWDIESLLPQKQYETPRQRKNPPSFHTDTTEISFGGASASEPVPSAAQPVGKLPPERQHAFRSPTESQRQKEKPEKTYRPNHPLIREVRIYRWSSTFRFYERFCQIAEALFDRRGTKCEPTDFFSYMPQYEQMTRAQLSWYLWWRECVRAGHYIETDYSYIFLFLFEILNLPEKVPPDVGQKYMCEIWRAYRKSYPLLDRYLADWICDYSLIHELTLPPDFLGEMDNALLENSTFKEFYACFPEIEQGQNAFSDAELYLRFCSNYDYRKSRAYTSDKVDPKLFDQHIPAAIGRVIMALKQENASFATSRMQVTTMNRDAFVGALCSFRVKRKIEVEYCSFSRSHELRYLITDLVKYAENKLRGVLGIKSKLTIYALPDKIREILDAYFAEAFPRKAAVRSEPERPAYEALYDLPKTELSMDVAERIEHSSWQTTKKLVEAFSDTESENAVAEPLPDAVNTAESQPDTVVLPVVPESVGSEPEERDAADIFKPYLPILGTMLRDDQSAFRAALAGCGKPLDLIADEINGAAVDVFGDILLEEDDCGGYRIIEEYRENVRSLLNETKGD